MEWQELEKAASAESVPEGLRDRIESLLAASETVSAEGTARHVWRRVALAAVPAAAAVALVLAFPGDKELKDTFDDPYLAYAEVEKTFNKISDKMSMGVEIASEARPVVDLPAEIYNKITQ